MQHVPPRPHAVVARAGWLECIFLLNGTIFGAPTPGGLGAADVALVEGALALIDGLTSGQAVAAALLVRVATLWFGVLIGAFALLRIETVLQEAKQTA